VADPKRLLELTEDAPSPNVLIQNLLGVARTEAAPDGARRRTRRSIDGVFSVDGVSAPEGSSSKNSAGVNIAGVNIAGKSVTGKPASDTSQAASAASASLR
jgi:hypothetical protein